MNNTSLNTNYAGYYSRTSLESANQGNIQAAKIFKCTCGVCPQCMKASGGGGGSTTKRTGMNWNEAYAEFTRLNKITQLHIDDLNADQTSKLRNFLDRKLSEILLNNKLLFFAALAGSKMVSAISNTVNNIQSILIKSISQISTLVMNQIKNIITQIKNNFINAVAQVAEFIGEKLKILKEFIVKNFKNVLARIFKKNLFKKFILVSSQEELVEFFEVTFKKVKEKIFGG